MSALITTSPTEPIVCAARLRCCHENREKPAIPMIADRTLMPVRTISAHPRIAMRTTDAPRVPSPARRGSQAAAPSNPPAPASSCCEALKPGAPPAAAASPATAHKDTTSPMPTRIGSRSADRPVTSRTAAARHAGGRTKRPVPSRSPAPCLRPWPTGPNESANKAIAPSTATVPRPSAHRSTACPERTAATDLADAEPDFERVEPLGIFAGAPRAAALRPARVVDGRAADFCERWAGDDREA